MQVKKLTPNLIVRNVEASLKFYREVLGLEVGITVPEQSPYVFGSVTNGAVEVFFNDQKTVAAEYPQLAEKIGGSLTLYMEVDSLQAVLERVQKAGGEDIHARDRAVLRHEGIRLGRFRRLHDHHRREDVRQQESLPQGAQGTQGNQRFPL